MIAFLHLIGPTELGLIALLIAVIVISILIARLIISTISKKAK